MQLKAKAWFGGLGTILAIIGLVIAADEYHFNVVKDLREQKLFLETQNTNLEDRLESVVATRANRNSPILISPQNDQPLIGNSIEFVWEPASHTLKPVYFLEIFQSQKLSYESFFIPHFAGDKALEKPVAKHEIFLSQRFPPGEFFWRVRQGEDGFAAPYYRFTIFKTSLARIQKTGQVLVGSVHGSETLNHLDSITRSPSGFEIDLMLWLVEELGKIIKKPPNKTWRHLKVKFIQKNWTNILPSLQKPGDIDLAISQITKTIDREEKHQIKFTNPYLKTRQRLLCSENNIDLNKKGIKFSVMEQSTNADIAKILQEKINSTIVIKELPFNKFLQPLLLGDAQVTVVDEIAGVDYQALYGSKLKFCDDPEDENSKDYFNKFDDLAIAVASMGNQQDGPSLHKLLNDILCEKTALEKIEKLLEKWFTGEDKGKNFLPRSINKAGGKQIVGCAV